MATKRAEIAFILKRNENGKEWKRKEEEKPN